MFLSLHVVCTHQVRISRTKLNYTMNNEQTFERLKKEVKGTCIRFPALPSNLLGKG